MTKVKIRYFVEKRGAAGAIYYWQPNNALTAAGWHLIRLPDDRRQAIAKAETLNAELDAWRTGTALPTAAGKPSPYVEDGTLAAVIRTYKASRFYTGLRERTKRSYKQNMDFLEKWGGDKRVAAITPETVEKLYVSLYERTPSKAAAVITMLRMLLQAAIRMRLVTMNAASKAGIKGRPHSGSIWPQGAIALFAEMADAEGWHSVGTAVILNNWLGQRQADILQLPRKAVADGRAAVLQSKTGARVSVPASPAITARISAELAHQKTLEEARTAALAKKGAIALPKDPPATLLLCETTGAPWTEHYFRHVFADIRAKLAKAHPTIAHPDGTEVDTTKLVYMHLRHTAVTAMAVSGSTAMQIAGVTGHSLAGVNQILARYLSLTSELADQAIGNRIAYEQRQAGVKG
jgi:hypothetical protein